MLIFQPGVRLTPKNTDVHECVQDIDNMSSCLFYVYPVVQFKKGKVVKYEAENMMSIIYFETLNIEWGQVEPKGIRRANDVRGSEPACCSVLFWLNPGAFWGLPSSTFLMFPCTVRLIYRL